jgi:hypothetical protein
MTVLGTASAIYVGSTAAVAVYAGSVKVWPTAPPGPPPSMVIVGAKFGVWLKSPMPQAELKGPQPYPVTFELDPTWFDSASPHPYWVDANNEAMTVRGPDGALSTKEQVRDAAAAGGATLTWVDPDWRLDPAGAPEPPAVVWPVIPDAGLVLHVHATLAEMQAPGLHAIDLQLTQPFRDAAGYMGTAAPTWRSSDYNGGTIRDLAVNIGGLPAKFSQVVSAESASLVTLEHVAGTGIGTWRMRVTQ